MQAVNNPLKILLDPSQRFVVTFPYSAPMVAALKAAIPLAMWAREARVWRVGVGSWREVLAFAERHRFELAENVAAKVAEMKATQAASRAVSVDLAIPVPDGLAYLPFQRAGIAFANGRPSTLIADEMGLGKTIQAIGLVNLDATMQHVLVVCPASLKLNWMRELGKWLVRPLTLGIAAADKFPLSDVVIINYDILHRHAEQIRAIAWDAMIVDECHYVKNPKTRRSVYLFGGKVKGGEEWVPVAAIGARRKLLLSGTPICNRPKELFPLLQALDRQAWPSFWKFATRYCGAKRNAFGFDASGSSNLGELQDILRSTVMVRRLKKDVLTELPPKRRQVIELPAAGAITQIRQENDAYQRCQVRLQELRVAVELAKASEDVEEYRSAVTSLRQGESVAFTEMAAERVATAIAKVPHVIEHLHDALDEGEHKIVLMAHHKEVIRRIGEEFGRSCVKLTGDMDMKDRQASVDRFQKDPSCVLFLGSIQAAGVGITLTASSHVVFAELDWVPGNVTQAEDRCHRIGQYDSVFVQHLVLEGSIDATMAHTLIAKQVVIDKALDVGTADRGSMVTPGAEPDEPVTAEPIRERAATQDTTRKQIEERALTITDAEIHAVMIALRHLSMLCDGAHSIDGSGFNKLDTRIGKELAGRLHLSPKQAALGLRIVRKYRKQLPHEVRAVLALGGEEEETDHEPGVVSHKRGPRQHRDSPHQEGEQSDFLGGEFSEVD